MLNGKTAIVTGSTSGIGQGIATALAGAGCNVVLNGFGDPAEIETLRAGLADEIEGQLRRERRGNVLAEIHLDGRHDQVRGPDLVGRVTITKEDKGVPARSLGVACAERQHGTKL